MGQCAVRRGGGTTATTGGGGGDGGDGPTSGEGGGAIALLRWRRLVRRLLRELALEARVSFAGALLSYWRLRRRVLLALRN